MATVPQPQCPCYYSIIGSKSPYRKLTTPQSSFIPQPLAHKQMSIDKPPLVLPLCLQRFSFHGRGVKDTRQIHFPRTLDISRYLTTAPTSPLPKYRLYAVVVHYGGSISSGHYVAYVTGPDNHWYLMDDAQVQPASEDIVLAERAYMLFYLRKGPLEPTGTPAGATWSLSAAKIPA